MDGEKRLWKYSAPSKAGIVIGLLFLLAAVVCAAMLVMNAVKPLDTPVTFTSTDDEPDSYCTLNVVGLSDAVLKRDSERWYLAEGTDGYFYLVKLSSSAVGKMTAQRAYWDEEGKKPAPVAVNGLARKITSEMFTVLVEDEGITVARARDILGEYYLDGTASPRSEGMSLWGMGLFFTAMFGGILTALTAGRRKSFRANLEALGGAYAVEQAAVELDAPTTERIGRDRLRLGTQHLFGKGNGLLLAYTDVLWVYQQVVRTYFVVTGRNLMIGDARGKVTMAYSVGRKGEDELNALAARIAEHNPSVMLGFSADNRKAWQALVKQRKGV